MDASMTTPNFANTGSQVITLWAGHTESSLENATCSGETLTNANIESQVPQLNVQSDQPTARARSQPAARTPSESQRQLDEYPLKEN